MFWFIVVGLFLYFEAGFTIAGVHHLIALKRVREGTLIYNQRGEVIMIILEIFFWPLISLTRVPSLFSALTKR